MVRKLKKKMEEEVTVVVAMMVVGRYLPVCLVCDLMMKKSETVVVLCSVILSSP